jgi:hypothetical protein
VDQAEFEVRVSRCVQTDEDWNISCQIEGVYTAVSQSPSLARSFVESRLSNPAEQTPLIAAVATAYMMVTGDGSLWPAVEEAAQAYSYIAYEIVEVLTPYRRAELWEEPPERRAAREHWLVSGRQEAVCDLCRTPLPRGADVDPAILCDGHRLAVTADVFLLDAHGMPGSRRDLKHDLRVAHQVAVLFAIVSDGHQLATTRAGADMLDDQPHEAGHFQADRATLERFQSAQCIDALLELNRLRRSAG